jgi:hypothetical protein
VILCRTISEIRYKVYLSRKAWGWSFCEVSTIPLGKGRAATRTIKIKTVRTCTQTPVRDDPDIVKSKRVMSLTAWMN